MLSLKTSLRFVFLIALLSLVETGAAQTWQEMPISYAGGVAAYSDDTIEVLSNQGILRTTIASDEKLVADRKNWDSIQIGYYLPLRRQFLPQGMEAISSQELYLGGMLDTEYESGNRFWNPAIRRSTDGGLNWPLVFHDSTNYSLEGRAYLHAVAHEQAVLYAVTGVYNTDAVYFYDHGRTDKILDCKGKFGIVEADFRDRSNGMALVVSLNVAMILRTRDGGQNWDTIHYGFRDAARSIRHLKGNIWISWMDGALYRTINDGETWEKTTTPSADAYVLPVSVTRGVYATIDTKTAIVSLTDDGKNWVTLQGPDAAKGYPRVMVSGNGKIYIAAASLYRTDLPTGVTLSREQSAREFGIHRNGNRFILSFDPASEPLTLNVYDPIGRMRAQEYVRRGATSAEFSIPGSSAELLFVRMGNYSWQILK